jgi:branched-chain amino acid transport system ATP-binding protein
MLEIAGLDVFYDEVQALRNVSLQVGRGEIVTLIGANGAGKTTTLKAISGLLRPAAGQIRFEGEPIGGFSPDAIVARGIAQVPEGRRIFPQLTVEENLKVGAHLVRGSRKIRDGLARVYELFPRLRERRRQAGQTLSGGEQQMLALGRAMMSEPRLLLLDEPSLGLAPLVVAEVMRSALLFRESGVTILLVEQNANLALAISDRGYVMETGRITMSDASTVLRRNPAVLESYLAGPREGGSAPDARDGDGAASAAIPGGAA